MSARPLVRFLVVTLGLGAAVAVVACHGRSWRSVIARVTHSVGGGHGSSGAGFGWRENPSIERDLSEVEATTEAIRSVLATLDEKERHRVLAPWLPLGPRPPAVIVAPVEGGLVPGAEAELVDLPAVVRALYSAHPSRPLVLAAFFVGTEPVSRARRRLKRLPEKISLRLLSRRLTWRERRALRPVREAEKWATLYALAWPVDRRWRITSGFGPRFHPVTGHASTHRGLDIGVPRGTLVRAPADGVVIRVARGRANGRWVEIDHGNGVRSIYCHLTRALLKRGARVKQGDVFAESGDTGRVTGPHLHYQVKLAGRTIDPLGARISPELVAAPVPLAAPTQGAAQAASR